MSVHRPSLLAVAGAWLAVVALSVAVLPATAATTDVVQRAETVLPPGNSQTYTVRGEAARNASGEPDDAGPWIDDQRELYFDYEMKDATFVASAEDCADAELTARDREAGLEPVRDGVDICWDAFGVPAVFGDTTDDVWYGHGWAAAKLRLFLLEGAWRTGMGTLAEIAGEGSDSDGDGLGDTLEQDIERRTTRYTVEELSAMVDALSPEAQASIDNYVEGVNAYIDWVTTTGRDQLPAEYAVLSVEPTPLTREAVAAVGVEMVRFVASEGRTEIITAQVLGQLEDAYGEELGRRVFRDLYWQEDDQAALTVLSDEGVFPRTAASEQERLDAFEAMADFAGDLPLGDLRDGPGIAPWVQLQTPVLDSGLGDGTGDEPYITEPLATPQAPGGSVTATGGVTAATTGELRPADIATSISDRVRESFGALAQEGASWMVMMAPSHTAGETLLMSEPQLDYDSGNFLMEVQLTGGGINARGATVAGIPIVGIGYTPDVAWALTTGNAKTIDSFVEQSRADSNGDGAPEYFHDGVWKDMACHSEDVPYRQVVQGVPVGPEALTGAIFTETIQVCRTVHGPVVSHTDDWSHALTWQWHVRDRELETIAGTLDWQGATSLADIEVSIPKLTWNENIGAVDSAGRIGFWHPGIHLERTTTSDLRLPIPGTGAFDLGDPLPQDALPHLVDPERGWIVNWNNKPAAGWLDGGGIGTTSYPAGPDQRVATLADLVAARDDWTFDDLLDLDRAVSQTDLRARSLLPFALDALEDAELSGTEQQALALLQGWDRNVLTGLDWPGFAETTSENPATVGAAPTLFDELVEQLDRELFTEVTLAAPLLVSQQYLGRHIADTDTHLHLAMRVMDPDHSSLSPLADYTGGRDGARVLTDAFRGAVAQLVEAQGDDVASWRNVYFDDGRGERGGKDGEVCTGTGALGPCGRHYYVERGAWVHHVGFGTSSTSDGGPTAGAPTAGEGEDAGAAEDDGALAATGGGAAVMAVLLLATGALTRVRSSRGRRRTG